MRFHCLGIPHTISNADYIACAFTQKVVKFCEMMKARGHYIIHYGHDRSKVVADEIVGTTNDAVLKEANGDYDWHSNVFKFAMDDPAYPPPAFKLVIINDLRRFFWSDLTCYKGFFNRKADFAILFNTRHGFLDRHAGDHIEGQAGLLRDSLKSFVKFPCNTDR